MYGARLRDVFDPDSRFNWADLRTAVMGLPPEGTALDRARRGSRAQWTSDRYLLAQVVDYLGELTWVTFCANVKASDQRKIQKPERVPRPGEVTPRSKVGDPSAPVPQPRGGPRRQSDHADVMRFFGKIRNPDGEVRDVSQALAARRLPTMTEVRPEFR